jgi:hypothetical protein
MLQPQVLAMAGRHSSSHSRHLGQLPPPPALLLLVLLLERTALVQLHPRLLLPHAACLPRCQQTSTQHTMAATAPLCAPQTPPQTHRPLAPLPTALPLAP